MRFFPASNNYPLFAATVKPPVSPDRRVSPASPPIYKYSRAFSRPLLVYLNNSSSNLQSILLARRLLRAGARRRGR